MRVIILCSISLSYQFLSTGVIVSIPFYRCASLQLNSIFSSCCRSFSHFIPEFISSVPCCVCFSRPPPLFFTDSIFIQEFSFHCASVVCSFLSYPVIRCEDSQELHVRRYSFLSSLPVNLIQLSVFIISFSCL